MDLYVAFPILSPHVSSTPSLIRLLTILPGTGDAPLRSKLQVVDLNDPDCPAYDAVSYRWDTVEASMALDIESTGGVLIRPNLEAALSRFRKPNDEIVVWTDAVCIDQRSSAEKNQQIPIMGRIYCQAAKVLVWLKPEITDEESNLALQFMKDLYASLRNPQTIDLIETFLHELKSEKSTSSADVCRQLGLPGPLSAEFAALHRLVRNSWFPRAWTSQESFLAREKVFFTGQNVDLEWDNRLFTMSFAALSTMDIWSKDCALFPEAFKKAETKLETGDERSEEEHDDRLTLVDLLQQRRGSECEFEADLVYSLLGVGVGPVIQVDVNLPFPTVFTTSTFDIMRHYGNLDVLGCVEYREQPSPLPSWVPDWRCDGIRTGFIVYAEKLSLNYRYHATSKSRPEIELINSRTLKAVGMQLDVIDLEHDWVPPHVRRPNWDEVIVVLLFGGKIPYVLRPKAGGHYTYVCEWFVPGFMTGEGMDEARQNPQVFYID